jgi:hypothetical protein
VELSAASLGTPQGTIGVPPVQFWEWMISPNHNEIVVDSPPASWSDLLWDWRISPNHSEIVVNDPFWDWVVSPNHNEIVVDDRA